MKFQFTLERSILKEHQAVGFRCAMYCSEGSPCTEETARAFAARLMAESFSRFEAPRLPAPSPQQSPADDLRKCRECGCEILGGVLCCECGGEPDFDDPSGF